MAKSDSERDRIVTTESMNSEARVRLSDALRGKGAHLSFDEAVRDFPEALINSKPEHVPYSFWHMLEHIRITQWDLFRYFADPKHVSPDWPAEYWPPQDTTTDSAGWNSTIEQYRADLAACIEFLRDPAVNLLAPLAHTRNRSVLRSAYMIVDHTAYHLGEFVMARQMLGYWKSELG